MKGNSVLAALSFGAVLFVGCSSGVTPPVPLVYSPWSAPQNLEGVVNSVSNDQHPALSPDGLSLYFASDRPGSVRGSLPGTLDLWMSQRLTKDSAWGSPVNLGPTVNSTYTEFAPNLSFDGHYLYFGSERTGGCGMRDVWAAYRSDVTANEGVGGWETPVDLGCVLNSSFFDDGPTYFQDPKTGTVTMYLTSQNRPGGLGDFDIWASMQQIDGTWAVPVDVAELNSVDRDTRTAIRHDGLEIFLTSMRPGGVTDANGAPTLDLWVSTRISTSDAWGAPVAMGNDINTAYSDGAPAISADGTELYFYSNRPGGSGLNDLYVVKRTKISG
jgi:hypothetical protein